MISPAPSASRIERYAAEAAAAHGVDPAEVTGTARTAEIVQARWAMWKRLSKEGFSTSSIARAVGCHHTTVRHALRK